MRKRENFNAIVKANNSIPHFYPVHFLNTSGEQTNREVITSPAAGILSFTITFNLQLPEFIDTDGPPALSDAPFW